MNESTGWVCYECGSPVVRHEDWYECDCSKCLVAGTEIEPKDYPSSWEERNENDTIR